MKLDQLQPVSDKRSADLSLGQRLGRLLVQLGLKKETNDPKPAYQPGSYLPGDYRDIIHRTADTMRARGPVKFMPSPTTDSESEGTDSVDNAHPPKP